MALSSVNLSTLADELLLPDGTSFSLTGDPSMVALSDTSLAGFSSTVADSFLIMSSGVASEVNGPNTGGSQGTDIGDSGTTGDTITLSFSVTAPDNADSFSFAFSFLSEEYPEFVGSTFNDYFSVTVNGTEVALDTNGNVISVNNDFFSDTLIPTGTFFDGQTPPLVVGTDVEGGETITVVLEVADVGDGIYDSAAFIGDFSFNQDQVVFVQFDEGSVEWPAQYEALFGLFTIDTEVDFTLPGAGLSATEQATIIAELNALYDDYNVEFTSTMPTSGEYSTVHVGGTVADVPAWLNAPASLFGLATSIDYGNQNQSDDAFVLAGEIRDGDTWDANEISLLTQVIAHEAGHIFGLRHVNEDGALMFPYAGAANTTISDGAPLGEINQTTNVVENVGGEQNSAEELARNLGLDGAQILISQESFFDQFLNYFSFSVGATGSSGSSSSNNGGTAPTIYNALAVVFTDGGDEEGIRIVSVVDLGTISDSADATFVLPAVSNDQVVVLGSSTDGGPLDVILSDGGVTSIDFDDLGLMGTLASLGVSVDDLGSTDLSFGSVGDDGAVEEIATVTAAVVDVSDTTATDGADVINGGDDADTIVGLGGNDTLSGEGGNDDLLGGEGSDNLQGGDGNDAMNGGDGRDGVFGGEGNDTLNGGADDDELAGSGGDDAVNGDAGNDNMGGGQGNDTMNGGTGNDTMGAGFGNDSLDGGAGDDGVFGGAGNDNVNGGDGSDNMAGSFGADAVNGGTGNDNIGGGTGMDTINGGSGNDSVGGGEGDDQINGGGGNDFLAGGGRDDMINGSNGNDTINGGSGSDTMTGGTGNDTFVFSEFTSGDADVITDWTNGEDVFRITASAINNAPGTGLQGKLDALNATQVGNDVQLEYGGNTILLQGASVSDLGIEDFVFV